MEQTQTPEQVEIHHAIDMVECHSCGWRFYASQWASENNYARSLLEKKRDAHDC